MALNESDIAHLIRRTEIVATEARIAELAALPSREAAVDNIMTANSTGGVTKPEGLTRNFYIGVGSDQWTYDHELRRWWINEMAFGKQPLREKMTLFWHGHFVTNSDSSASFVHTLACNQLYREYAFGNLQEFAKKMSVEPSMLTYLNNSGNTKWQRNENFARELMELFLLGLNHYGLISGQDAPYTQDDVVAASKAWTGHNIVWDPVLWPYYQYNANAHVDETITLLGKTAKFDGFAMIDHIFTTEPYKTISARYIATKLWSYFSYPNPDATMIANLVTSSNFANTHDIGSLLRAILVHPEFYSATAKTGIISTPAEYTARVLRTFGVLWNADHNQRAVWQMVDMGQELLSPPNVAGWKQNSYWLSTSELGARALLAQLDFSSSASTSKFLDLDGASPDNCVTLAAHRLGIVSLAPETKTNLVNWVSKERARAGSNANFRSAGLLHLLLLSPDFLIS